MHVNEYTGRITAMLTGARVASSVALFYPINMFQMEYKPIKRMHWGTWQPARQKAWDSLQAKMLNADVNYNIIHPDWLSNAKIKGSELKIGSGSYRYLVMPDVEVISTKVLSKIQQFEAVGGTVLWVDDTPSAGAYPAEDATVTKAVATAGYSALTAEKVVERITNPYNNAFKLQVSSDQILTTRFNRSGQSLYFLVNPTGAPATAQLDYGENSGILRVYNPVSGDITESAKSAEVKIDGYRSVLVLSEPHSQSR